MSSVSLPQLTTLGEMLKYLRRHARLTQRELSIAVGYSEGQISRLESNQRKVDAATLQALFVPALDIEDQPEMIGQLLALAADPPLGAADHDAVAGEASPSRRLSQGPLTNLPRRLTSFVGRETAIASLHELIPKTRIVTLTGVGGVGKTSLAAVLGARLLATFPDGVWWVDLASLMDTDAAPQAVAATFKLPAQPERTYLEGITTYLQDRHLLLVLDNCEHLIDACAMLADQLLRSCPQLHILATSRETLRVEGEVEWLVTPLSTPKQEPGAGSFGIETMMQSYEAVQLLVERTRATQPTLAWTDQDADSIARLCRQLDGIPLAIELAASRLKGLTIGEFAARLDQRFQLLTDGARTALPRHQTLRATLDWSYYLLSEEERALLARLSVFRGGWTLDAVEAIAAAQSDGLAPIPNPAEALLQLVNRSLVVAETQRPNTRYRLLETIREYAAEKLQETDDVRAVRTRHFKFYLALAEQSRTLSMTGRGLAAWGDRIAAEMDNLRRAAVWADEQQDNGEQGLRLAGSLWLFWYNSGGLREGQTWLTRALSYGTAVSPQTRATALYGLANLLLFSTNLLHRAALAEEAFVLSQQANDDFGCAHCFSLLGDIAMEHTDYQHALACYQQALDLFQTLNCRHFATNCMYGLANVWLQLGQVDKAIPILEQGIPGATGDEDDLFASGLVVCHVYACLCLADRLQGRRFFEEALAKYRALGAPKTIASLLHAYGRSLLLGGDRQDVDRAFQMLTECLTLWRQLGITWGWAGGTARAYMDLGHIYTLRGEYTLALEYEQEASRLYYEAGDLHGDAWAQMSMGWPAIAQGALALAEASFQNSLRSALDGGLNIVPYALLGLAETWRQQGKLARSARLFGVATRFTAQDVAEYAPLEKFSNLQAARIHLDSAGFAAAWADGEVMTVEQAIAHALE